MASLSSSPSSASSSRSSSFSSSAHRRNASARGRGLPRRGQVKAAIFASLFASIASVLGLRAQSNGANEEADHADSESRQPSSDFEVDVDNDTRLFDAEEEGARMELRVPASGMSASFSTVQHGSPHSHAVTVEGQVRVEGIVKKEKAVLR